MRLNTIDISDEKIAELCRTYGVRRLWLFGSVLRGDFRPDSDIDVLVETDPANPPGLLASGGLQMDLSDLLGRTVDHARRRPRRRPGGVALDRSPSVCRLRCERPPANGSK